MVKGNLSQSGVFMHIIMDYVKDLLDWAKSISLQNMQLTRSK